MLPFCLVCWTCWYYYVLYLTILITKWSCAINLAFLLLFYKTSDAQVERLSFTRLIHDKLRPSHPMVKELEAEYYKCSTQDPKPWVMHFYCISDSFIIFWYTWNKEKGQLLILFKTLNFRPFWVMIKNDCQQTFLWEDCLDLYTS